MLVQGLLVAVLLSMLVVSIPQVIMGPISVQDSSPAPMGPIVEVVFDFSEVQQVGTDPRDLAVAFHSINYLDAEANSLGVLIFGTAEANALQGSGWYKNEVSPDVGFFQWAGTAAKQATISLPLPDDTVGLLLNITAIVDGIWMGVTVDGVLKAELRVDAYWDEPEWGRSGYVPVAAMTPEPVPHEEPEWLPGYLVPRFPAAGRIYVIRVKHVLENQPVSWQSTFRIDDSFDTMMALTLVGMQGLINRHGPRVYLDWSPDKGRLGETFGSGARNLDTFWLPFFREHVDVVYLDLDGLSAIIFLYQRFQLFFDGAVIYSPEIVDTINLATMYAGLENRMILSPEQSELFSIPSFSSVVDLEYLAFTQLWTNSESGKYRLYQWVWTNLWHRLEHRIIGMVSPGPPTSRSIPPSTTYCFPLSLACRDYMVALKLPVLWLSPYESPQDQLFSQFLADADAREGNEYPVCVSGFFANNEQETVRLTASHGDWVSVMSHANGPVSGGSLSVFSGISPTALKYPNTIDIDRLFATMGMRPILTLVASDGDNIEFQIDRGFHGPSNFFWPEVQNQRFGWTINPVLADLAPLVWTYYVTTRSEVSLVCGLSGAGYTYPAVMTTDQLHQYLYYTNRYLRDTRLRVVRVDKRFGTLLGALEHEIMNAYDSRLTFPEYLGTYIGHANWPWGLGFYYSAEPMPSVYFSYGLNASNGKWIIADLLARRSGEYFVNLTAENYWNKDKSGYQWHHGKVDLVEGALRFSTSDFSQAGRAIWGPFSVFPPGDYEVTYRLKVTDNSLAENIARMYVGYDRLDYPPDGGNPTHQWNEITSQLISATDFTTAGEFQDLKIAFTTTEYIPEIEFRLDYIPNGGASPDLLADYILAKKLGGLNFPVVAGVFLCLTQGHRITEAPQLAYDFEQAGGVALNPDEFMAILNPAFMLTWATPKLGPSHPALATAQAQIDAGDYLASLITLRNALYNFPIRTYKYDMKHNGKLYISAIQANTWVTGLGFHQDSRNISYQTHGPPDGTTSTIVWIPKDVLQEPFQVIVDGAPHPCTLTQNSTHYEIAFSHTQGPHSVGISERDVTPPAWVETPRDQWVEFGDDFHYDLDATDPSGVAAWDLSATPYFTINTDGVITNTVPLPVGVYELQVSVRDTLGNTNNQIFTVTVEDTTPPIWTTPPVDQTLELGESLDLQLEAWDLSGISAWYLSDTTHFTIDNTGRITSIDPLAPEVYTLDVMVEDPYGNTLSSEFSVHVNRETTPEPPPIPGFPFPSIILGLFGVIVVSLVLRQRKRKR